MPKAPAPVLDWGRAASGVGVDGRFPFGVFMVRRQLGRYKLGFLPSPEFSSLSRLPSDDSERKSFLDRDYEKEQQAVFVAEGMAIAMLERQRKPDDLTGDNITDSIVRLLREDGGKLSKSEILARLHFTESQWERFKLSRPESVKLESHGRGARYYYEPSNATARRPPRSNVNVAKFDDYVGQDAVIGRMRKYVESAKSRGAPLGHVLLSGPPGIGKTTLARVIANELGRPFHVLWGPNFDVQNLRTAQPLDVVFIDEIHALPTKDQEQLFDTMARGVTVIGATTYPGKLTGALRDRFGIKETLEMHSLKDLQEILMGAAARDKADLPPAVAMEIARRSRGSARLAIYLMQHVRDIGGFTPEGAKSAFRELEIDDLGLTRLDRRYLAILKASDEPVGLETLATRLGESVETVETAIEPFLMQIGMVERTGRGRRITEKGAKHLQAFERKGKSAKVEPPGEGAQREEPKPAQEPERSQSKPTQEDLPL